MASIALFVAGSAVGGAIGGTVLGVSAAAVGGAVGGAIGSYIDSQFLFKQDTPDVNGPRIEDYKLSAASEGALIPYAHGCEAKVTGAIIWIGEHVNDTALTIMEERSTTKKVGGKGGGGGTQTTYSYYLDVAVALCEEEVNAVRIIWADSKVIFTTEAQDDRYEGITVYTGGDGTPGDASMSNNLLPNSHIEAFEGAGNVPRYQGVSYFVLDSLNVNDFGRRVPTFNALVERDETISVRSVISDILDRAGLTGAQYDVSRVKECFTGYHVTGPIESARVLEPILQAYDILVAEVDGVLHFFHRGDEQVVIVDSDDLGSIGGPYPVQFSQINDYDTPSSVGVSYIDANNSYDRGEELFNRIGPATGNEERIDIPMVIDSQKAATIAKRRLYRALVERLEISMRLPPSYLQVTEADVLQVTVEGETYDVLVYSKQRGQDGTLEFIGRVVDQTITELTADSSSSQNNEDDFTPYTAPTMETRALSIPGLIDRQTLAPTTLVAASTLAAGTPYTGSVDYESPTDTTSDFSAVEAMPALATMGTCNTTLGGGVVPELIDNTNTIDVTLLRGSLSSTTVSNVARGQNHCLVGGEIIGFTTATLVDTNRYELTGLFRGRRHTFDQIDSHGASEDFLLLESGTLLEGNYSPGLFGSTRYHRAVPTGGQVGDQTSDSVVLDGASVKPFSPTAFTSSRDGSNNLTIEWVRRTRAIWDPFSASPAPIYEGQEVYEIDVLSGSGGSVVRTISVEDATDIIYTAAEQTADGLTPGNPVYAIAYMVDIDFGRGWPTEELTL